MNNRAYLIISLIGAILISLLAGCGGGGAAGAPPTPPAPSGTAQIQGEVRAADNLSLALSYAEIAAQPAAVATTANSQGSFTLRNLPAGNITLNINPVHHPEYQAGSLVVPTESGKVSTVVVALLPSAAEPPTQIIVVPDSPSVEVGGVIDFTSTVSTATGTIGVSPTWQITGDIGFISSTGHFQANNIGIGTVTAIIGGVSDSTTVEVTPPEPPDISTVIVSPASLPPSGGAVSIVAAVCDGQGIGVDGDGNPRVQAQIALPGGGTADPPLLMDLDAGTLQDGTYRITYAVGPNDNEPDSAGVQAPQTYTVRIETWDTVGNKTTSSPYTFVVQGVLAPPPPLPLS